MPESLPPALGDKQVRASLRAAQLTIMVTPTDASGRAPTSVGVPDAYGTGWHAAHEPHVTAGDTVTIIGDGAVGLLAVFSARQFPRRA